MVSRSCLSVLSVLVILLAASVAEEQTLRCYKCAGYLEAEPTDQVYNNPSCNLDTFSPTNLTTVSNTSTDPTLPVLCYTIAVYVRDQNGGQPYTVRDLVNTDVVPDKELAVTLGQNAARLAKENRKMFIKGEICLYDLCNDGTGAFNSTGRTNIAPVLVLLALCFHKLLM